MNKRFIAAVMLTLLTYSSLPAQDETDPGAKYLSWAAMQLLPSPVLFHDGNIDDNRVVLGLRWQITPINISFRANKYISPVQFFMINPVRKFTGSIELFVQPEWSAGNFKYSRLGRFGISTGSRITLPVAGDGEYLSFSLGGKYNYRKDLDNVKDDYFGIETGIYAIYGILGLQFNYNINAKSKYNVGLYLKYF